MTAPATVQLVEIARTDLRLEARAGEALFVTLPFGAAALVLVPLAVGADLPLLRAVGAGMYWVVVLLFGVLVTLRQSAADSLAQRELLRLCGVRPATRAGGRILSNTLWLLALELLLGPVAIALYGPELTGWPWLLAVLPLVAAGLAALGALADGLSTGLGERMTLAPLLAVPLALPLLVAATQISEGAAYGRPAWPWLLLLVTVDLVVVSATLLSAGALEEAL